jgi:protoporphyrinogen oxidase
LTRAPGHATEKRERVVILGAGVGGLAAGYFLARTGRYDVTVLEQASVVGGLCASFEHKGFVLDHGAHKLHSVIPGILDEIRALMGDRLVKLEKRNRISLGGGLLDYPLRLSNVARVLGIGELMRLGVGYAAAFAGGFLPRPPERSYEQYIVRRFGRPVYERVFAPLAEKVWGDPATLHPDMARTRIPATGGLDVILRLLKLRTESEEKNARYFYYPRAGFGDWPEALREQIVDRGGRVLVNTRVDALERGRDGVDAVLATVGGSAERFPCDYLVSSVPLPVLAGLVFGQSDPALQEAVTGLQFRHLVLVYLFVHRPLILEDQWIFFPEDEFLFSRIFEQKQMNPALGPPNETAVCCDFTCTEESWQWAATDDELALRRIILGTLHHAFVLVSKGGKVTIDVKVKPNLTLKLT